MHTNHSRFYTLVKKYYDAGLWLISRVRVMVAKNVITADEYKSITGEEY